MTPTQLVRGTAPLHVAIIMDGNGRWASARAMPRAAGHRAGVETVRNIVEASPDLGIGTLTLYTFSSDNWQRPSHEVSALMRLFRSRLTAETPKLRENDVRLSVIGRRDRLAHPLRNAIRDAERETSSGERLHLRLAIDYSSRDAIVAAAQHLGPGHATRERFAAALAKAYGSGHPAPDVDLLVRTGGEHRLSDFLLWECAYAELYFSDRMWPEFSAQDLSVAVREFQGRERRFGALPAAG